MFIYHKTLGFPRTLRLEENYSLNVVLSSHAQQACFSDRYGNIKVNANVSFGRKDIVEVESSNNKIPTKFLVRIKYNDNHDINIAIQLDNNTIKTVWLNEKNDKHTTLNRNNYDKPQQVQTKIKW